MEKGDILYLNDYQTLSEGVESSNSIRSKVPFTVSRIRTFIDENMECTWTFIEVEEDNLVLLKKEIEELSEWRVYFPPDDFTTGNREDVFNADCDYIFSPDDVEEELPIEDMRFANSIEHPDGLFINHCGGMFCGDYEDGYFFIAEWQAEFLCDNPELLVLEIQADLNDDDSYIIFLEGCVLKESEIELI